MTAHKELIERLRFYAKEGAMNFGDMTAAADALESQALEMEGLRLKAARYDWLRDAGAWEAESVLDSLAPEEFDERVDAAMAAKGTT